MISRVLSEVLLACAVLALIGCNGKSGAELTSKLEGSLYAMPVASFSAYVAPSAERSLRDVVEAFAVAEGFAFQFSSGSTRMDLLKDDQLIDVSRNPVVSRPGRDAYDLTLSRLVNGKTETLEFVRLESELRKRACGIPGVTCVQSFPDGDFALQEPANPES